MELYNVHNGNTSNTLVGKESLFVPINVSKVQLIASMQPEEKKTGKLINLPSQSVIKRAKKNKFMGFRNHEKCQPKLSTLNLS